MKQHDSETINVSYHHILKLPRQYQFDNIDEHLIDAIVFGYKSKTAQDKLLQMPIRMTLEECLLIYHHYESLQWHINTIRPTSGDSNVKAMDGLSRHHSRSRNSNANANQGSTSARHTNKSGKTCTACGTVHKARKCPASSQVCYKCDKQGHYAKLCHSKTLSTTSMLTSNRNTRGSWRADIWYGTHRWF